MSLGRRKVSLGDQARWVFNRMAEVYLARPPYPGALLDAIEALARQGNVGPRQPIRLCDIGAGVGHLAIPLAARGLEVVAVEPARRMLEQLQAAAAGCKVPLRAVHAPAEILPLGRASVDVVVIADALHFLDAELAAREIDRVMKPRGALAVITSTFGSTPFMEDVLRIIGTSVPRRPRPVAKQLVQIGAITRVPFADRKVFDDHTAVDHQTLERILRSISFIGPAMNEERFTRFAARIRALTDAPVWSRTFVLASGWRKKRSPDARRPPSQSLCP